MPSYRWVLTSLVAGVLLITLACDRAQRYPEIHVAKVAKSGEEQVKTVYPHYGWIKPEPPTEHLPMVYVAAGTRPDEWKQLPEFWNHFPPPALGMRTLHLGQSPLGTALVLFAAEPLQVIKLKVPLGLPDPTPYVPAANPLTFEKWRLGQMLFFDDLWLTERDGISCASCHQPRHGFTEDEKPNKEPWMHTPSLINCVYNKTQFWDGRVKTLEEVIQRQLDEELAPAKTKAEKTKQYQRHSWGGIVPRLSQRKQFVDLFQKVYGIPQPTTDTVAKSLATYLRTLLSGNSLYDQAKQAAGKEIEKLAAKHFQPLLNDAVLQTLQRNLEKPETVAGDLEYGHELFFSKRCNQCHSGPLFTDDSFHNVGIRESDVQYKGYENGHFAHQPFGLKDPRMLGAFKTPSLRGLVRTPPYFHDGSRATLEDVIKYYNKEIYGALNPYLDLELGDDTPKQTRKLNLTGDGASALALFLRALNGEPVPKMIATPPGK